VKNFRNVVVASIFIKLQWGSVAKRKITTTATATKTNKPNGDISIQGQVRDRQRELY